MPPALEVPSEFNRNSPKVLALMPVEESGAWLLERLRQRTGHASWTGVKLLDFGCGVRFTQAIVAANIDIGLYHGVDVYPPMIEWLQQNVRDERFAFTLIDARHPNYNPTGTAMSPAMTLPLAEQAFDVASMFSVITHQNPDDAASIFTALHRHVRPGGHLFFTCFLDDSIEQYEDRSANQDGGICFYNPRYLAALVERCGWREVSRAPSEGPIIGDSFVYSPA